MILSLKQVLQCQIFVSLNSLRVIAGDFPLSPSSIPLRSNVTPTHLCYCSAIALKASNQFGLAPEALALKLLAQLQTEPFCPWGEFKLCVSVELEAERWLKLAIAYGDLIPWLRWASEQMKPLPTKNLTIGLTAPSPFAYLQYAQTRSYSLHCLYPQPSETLEIPTDWIMPKNLRSLLETVIQTLDGDQQIALTKLALNLSKSLLQFERQAWQLNLLGDETGRYCAYYLILICQKRLGQLLGELGYAAPQQM